MTRQHQYSLYDIFTVLFVTTLLVSNIVSVKIVSVGWLTFDAGTVLFPLAYIVGDIITEVYGYRQMRRLIYNGVAALMLMTLTFWVVQLLPADSSWTGQAAFESTLGVVWRLAIGSVAALFVGEIMNAYVMGRMKVARLGGGQRSRYGDLLDDCFCRYYADDQLLAAYHHGVFDQDGGRDYGLAADYAFDYPREKA